MRYLNNLSQRLRRADGYTIDQTILIVAIIAILVTIIILTVGWNIINKASGTKLAAQFKQIEDANGQFYAQHRTWPHRAYTRQYLQRH
jgi:Tfp pilus assembly protein PilE